MSRWRVTLRNNDTELRGYMDVPSHVKLKDFAKALEPFNILVVVSPADADYDPFDRAELWEELAELDRQSERKVSTSEIVNLIRAHRDANE